VKKRLKGSWKSSFKSTLAVSKTPNEVWPSLIFSRRAHYLLTDDGVITRDPLRLFGWLSLSREVSAHSLILYDVAPFFAVLVALYVLFCLLLIGVFIACRVPSKHLIVELSFSRSSRLCSCPFFVLFFIGNGSEKRFSKGGRPLPRLPNSWSRICHLNTNSSGYQAKMMRGSRCGCRPLPSATLGADHDGLPLRPLFSPAL